MSDNVQIQAPIEITITESAVITAQVAVQAPIELQAIQEGIAVGPKGDKGDKGDPFTFMEGAKSSATDAGTISDISITDDYIYWCVKTGTAGNAIWKRAVVFAT